jgi:hypothetical protein
MELYIVDTKIKSSDTTAMEMDLFLDGRLSGQFKIYYTQDSKSLAVAFTELADYNKFIDEKLEERFHEIRRGTLNAAKKKEAANAANAQNDVLEQLKRMHKQNSSPYRYQQDVEVDVDPKYYYELWKKP